MTVEEKRQKITPELSAEVVRRFKGGESITSILAALGISKRSAYNVLERNGVKRRALHSLTPEQELEVVQRHKDGETLRGIASNYGVNFMTIQNTLRRHGVDKVKPRITDKQKNTIVEACRTGSTAGEAARAGGASVETVFRILRDADIRLPAGRPRSCKVDDTAFDVLTPEGLYWIGFLFADGCISRTDKGSPRLICTLGEKDRAHVVLLRSFLKSTHAIIEVPKTKSSMGGPFVSYSVRSRPICDALTTYGIVTKRTRVPVDALVGSHDFWRGAVDGDGWLGTARYGEHLYPYVGLSGQHLLLEAFQRFLSSRSLTVLNIVPTESGIWRVETSGSGGAGDIVRTLYENATVGLDRKLGRARAIMSGDMTKSTPYIEGPGRQKIDDETSAELLRAHDAADADDRAYLLLRDDD